MSAQPLTREQAKHHQSRLIQTLIDHDMPAEYLAAVGDAAHWLSLLCMSDLLPSSDSLEGEGRSA